MKIQKRDGSVQEVDISKIRKCVERSCEDLTEVSVDRIVDEAVAQLYDGITTNEIDRSLVLTARQMIVDDPEYAYAAARLLLVSLYKEAFNESVEGETFDQQYRDHFVLNLQAMVHADRINPDMLATFDILRLADAIKPERDKTFKYLGLQTLYDRYFIHLDQRRMETPQAFWMRVAMGICLNEDDPTARAIEAYELFSRYLYCPGTPTLFNSGTCHSQLSSCYLSTIEDSIDGIFGTFHGQARLSKFAGGLGVDFTNLRGIGAYIKGTNGEGQGIIPWMKVFNDLLVSVNQGGKRKGAGCAYLETWHSDIRDFLELRKNTGDDRRRCHDMNTANWIPDLFMKQVECDGPWYLFSPDECPELHETFGEEFERLYWEMVEKGFNGELRSFEQVPAKDLWKRMLSAIFETGHPWITWKDPSNIRYSNKHAGTVHSSNLCTEILLHTKPSRYENGRKVEVGETAVCNLGSINVAAHANEKGEIDWLQFDKTVRTAIRLLDNVIDINFYPTEEAEKANMLNRPVGLGLMGWHDLLHKQGLVFGSPEAVRLSDMVHAAISHIAIDASAGLARERGYYPNFIGSEWHKRKLPIDTYVELMDYRNHEHGVRQEALKHGDVEEFRDLVSQGMRNSNVMAIAPTATISFICGCSQSIEPDFSMLYTYSTLSGEFTMFNEHFVARLKSRGLWGPHVAEWLKSTDGDIKDLPLPDDIKQEFRTAFDQPYQGLIDMAAARQKWIDQGQSLNLYYAGSSLKELNDMYFYAWKAGLKTTYYLRTKAASKVEKSVGVPAFVPVVEPEEPMKQCRIDDPTCEACQ